MMKKAVSIVLTIAMGISVSSISVGAVENNGPSDDFTTFLSFSNSNDENPVYGSLYSYFEEDITTIEGMSYDLETNTLTITDFNNPDIQINANEMGEDFTIELVGENHLQALTIWGFGYGAGLEITGNGSLMLNENRQWGRSPVRIEGEGANGFVHVDNSATVTIYTMNNPEEPIYPISVSDSSNENAIILPDDEDMENVVVESYNTGLWSPVYKLSINMMDKCTPVDTDTYTGEYVYSTMYRWDEFDNEYVVFYIYELISKPEISDYPVAEFVTQVSDPDEFNIDFDPEGYSTWENCVDVAFLEVEYLPMYYDKNSTMVGVDTTDYYNNGEFMGTFHDVYELKNVDGYDIPIAQIKYESLDNIDGYVQIMDDAKYYNTYYNSDFYTHAGEIIPEYIPGDINGNGAISIDDVTIIQRAVAGMISLSSMQNRVADINGDGSVDINDATYIQRVLAQII